MKDKDKTLTDHQRLWLGRIKACEASGLPMTQFAAANDLSVRTMYDTKKALVNKGALPRKRRSRFQRVRVAPAAVPDNQWQIRLPNGVMVSFSGAVDSASLTQVLSTVARLG